MTIVLVCGQPLLSLWIGDTNTNTCPFNQLQQRLLPTNTTFKYSNSTKHLSMFLSTTTTHAATQIQSNLTKQNAASTATTSTYPQTSSTSGSTSSTSFRSTRFLVILFVNIAASVFDGCMISLVDAGVIKRISLSREPKDYGWNRLFGAIGFSTGSFLSGLVSDLFPYTMRVNCFTGAYVVYACFVIGLIAVCPFLFKFPALSKNENNNKDKENSSTMVARNRNRNLKKVVFKTLKRFEVILFFSTVLVMGTLQGFYINFTALRLKEMDSPIYLVGLTLSTGAIAAIPAFMFGSKLVNLFGGYWPTLWICCMSYVVRFVAFGYITNPWLAIPIHTLQSFGFGLNLVTSVLFIKSISTPQIYTTMYALMNTTFFGIGYVIASIAGGQLFSWYEGRVFFTGCGVFAAGWNVVLAVFIVAIKCFSFSTMAEPKKSVKDVKDRHDATQLIEM